MSVMSVLFPFSIVLWIAHAEKNPQKISCLFLDYGVDTKCSFVVVLQFTTQNDDYNAMIYNDTYIFLILFLLQFYTNFCAVCTKTDHLSS